MRIFGTNTQQFATKNDERSTTASCIFRFLCVTISFFLSLLVQNQISSNNINGLSDVGLFTFFFCDRLLFAQHVPFEFGEQKKKKKQMKLIPNNTITTTFTALWSGAFFSIIFHVVFTCNYLRFTRMMVENSVFSCLHQHCNINDGGIYAIYRWRSFQWSCHRSMSKQNCVGGFLVIRRWNSEEGYNWMSVLTYIRMSLKFGAAEAQK